jgi:hypothetical protein
VEVNENAPITHPWLAIFATSHEEPLGHFFSQFRRFPQNQDEFVGSQSKSILSRMGASIN